MDTTASKKSAANGSDRASAWIGNTPSSTPASRIRWRFSEALNHRSVAHTCTPNSRRRKIDDDARPQPRSSTRMPGRRSSACGEPLGQPQRVGAAAGARRGSSRGGTSRRGGIEHRLSDRSNSWDHHAPYTADARGIRHVQPQGSGRGSHACGEQVAPPDVQEVSRNGGCQGLATIVASSFTPPGGDVK